MFFNSREYLPNPYNVPDTNEIATQTNNDIFDIIVEDDDDEEEVGDAMILVLLLCPLCAPISFLDVVTLFIVDDSSSDRSSSSEDLVVVSFVERAITYYVVPYVWRVDSIYWHDGDGLAVVERQLGCAFLIVVVSVLLGLVCCGTKKNVISQADHHSICLR